MWLIYDGINLPIIVFKYSLVKEMLFTENCIIKNKMIPFLTGYIFAVKALKNVKNSRF